MGKNIVICCDGTGNQFGDRNSNVVKLYKTLVRDAAQIAYYHPGVGTMGAKNALTVGAKAWTKFRGLAFGYGLSENIADAYGFLMHTFEPGDKVFVFGFSRGGYIARALCGLLQMFGLLSPGNEGLIPYAIRLFKKGDGGAIGRIKGAPSKFTIAKGFKTTFCRECKPHFLGLWDTVSSVGWILDPIGLKQGRLPYTFALKEVTIIRHAVSIDEKRAFFRQNLVKEEAGRNIKQVWFAGVHSDVGGSYPESESGLSKFSLRWMLDEARTGGLRIDASIVAKALGADPAFVKPLASAVKHNSLTPAWWLGEFWPKWTKKLVSKPGEPVKFTGAPRLNLFRPRFVPEGACVHESVLNRKALVPDYKPRNLPSNFKIEPESSPSTYPKRLQAGEKAIIGVHARAKWNDTELQLLAGEEYLIEATGRWHDASNASGPGGYKSPSLLFRLAEIFRRVPNANWFALIAAIGQDESRAFVIGESSRLTVLKDGVMYCFANDLRFLYCNNSGMVTITVTRLT